MIKREKINKTLFELIGQEHNQPVEQYIIEDYEKLKNKCDEIIVKIKNRKKERKKAE